MKEIYLTCDSPCFSCPVIGRILRITNFNQRKLENAFYCNECDIYYLCRKGLAFTRTNAGDLKPICTKCGRYLQTVELSYEVGQDERPFSSANILIIRKENGSGYTILQGVKGAYFKDLAEVFLYILFTFGADEYNIVNYNSTTKQFNEIFNGELFEDKVVLRLNAPIIDGYRIVF